MGTVKLSVPFVPAVPNWFWCPTIAQLFVNPKLSTTPCFPKPLCTASTVETPNLVPRAVVTFKCLCSPFLNRVTLTSCKSQAINLVAGKWSCFFLILVEWLGVANSNRFGHKACPQWVTLNVLVLKKTQLEERNVLEKNKFLEENFFFCKHTMYFL